MNTEELFIDGNKLPKALSKHEIYELLELIQNGDSNAREKLVEHNIRLVLYEVTGKFKNVNYDTIGAQNLTGNFNYKNDIIVDGFDDILVTLANCCHPVMGDDIVGYITKGEGINVHKSDCINVKNFSNRTISVKWNQKSETTSYLTKITITTSEGNNNLLSIVTKASQRDVVVTSISEIESNTKKGYNLTIKVKNNETLELFVEDLKSLSYVTNVSRGNLWK